MKIEKLAKQLAKGEVEVEDIIGFGLEANRGHASKLRELAALQLEAEKEIRRQGGKTFPLSRWLGLSADFAESGYQAFISRATESRDMMSFIMAFCREDKASEDCWQFLSNVISQHSSGLHSDGRKSLLEGINLVFSFQTIDHDGRGYLMTIHDFVLKEVLCAEHLAFALYASRGFPSESMLAAVEAAPESKVAWKDAKASALAKLKRAVKKK